MHDSLAAHPFRVAITADGAEPDGSTIFGDLGLDRLTDTGIEWHVLDEDVSPIPVEKLAGVNAVLSLAHAAFGAETVDRLPELRLIARFGAGYDTIDLDACTRAGVAVTNTPDGIRRPLALGALTMVLALAHNLRAKDVATRAADWGARGRVMGEGVDGRTLGIVGFGNVGSDLAVLAAGLGFRVVGANRSGRSERARELGVEMMDLDALLAASDYVVVTASLNAESHHLIDERRLRLLKETAFFVNVGRGALVDQRALTTALRERWFAGAGLDVFDPEPVAADDELLTLDNVLLSPHCLPWTKDFTRDVSASVLGAILDVAAGRRPAFLLNPEVLDTDEWARKEAARAPQPAADTPR